MNIEKIFSMIPEFKNVKLDKILFESRYPVLFTCVSDGKVYLFSCYLVSHEYVKWLGTETNYQILIDLLQDKITLYDAFYHNVDKKILIEFDGMNVRCSKQSRDIIPQQYFPTQGEYMDVEGDEFIEEITEFKLRRDYCEFIITSKKIIWSPICITCVLDWPTSFGSREAEENDFSCSVSTKKELRVAL